jgi:tRNA dimethylallyltransferase
MLLLISKLDIFFALTQFMNLPSDILKQCWFLAGPTAVGKSEAGVELAKRIGAEIVSLDSMSIYRGMDVGTAKPSAELRRIVPHHLIDVVEPHEEFSVAQYVDAAAAASQQIVSRGRVPLFVGGTGLYLRSLLRGVFEGPSANLELRQELQADAARLSPGALHARLQSVDPVSAARIHANDTRRVIRALEVYTTTGLALSQFQRQLPLPVDERPSNVFWLAPPRAWLHKCINRRVEKMFAEGLLDEVRRLLASPQPLSRTARQALGYQEAIDHLAGRFSLEETITRIQARTRQFAKRQHTWFRHLEECRTVGITGDETASELAERLSRITRPH